MRNLALFGILSVKLFAAEGIVTDFDGTDATIKSFSAFSPPLLTAVRFEVDSVVPDVIADDAVYSAPCQITYFPAVMFCVAVFVFWTIPMLFPYSTEPFAYVSDGSAVLVLQCSNSVS